MDVVFSHWSVSWPVLIAYVLAAGLHGAGLPKLLRRGSGDGATDPKALWREAALYQLGILLVLLALVSPAGYYSSQYIWVRGLQELVVGVFGPGLIVLGAPWAAVRLAVGRPAGGDAEGWPPRLLSRPLLVVIAVNVLWVGWQFPPLFDAARSNSALAFLEHAGYLAAGLLFWLQMISSRPLRQRVAPLRRMAWLVSTVVVWTVLGMVLVFGASVLYPAYHNPAHHVMTVLDDQQLSGAVLWMGVLPAMLVLAVALMMEWLRDEESAELSAGLDRLLAPRRNGWPSRPVIR